METRVEEYCIELRKSLHQLNLNKYARYFDLGEKVCNNKSIICEINNSQLFIQEYEIQNDIWILIEGTGLFDNFDDGISIFRQGPIADYNKFIELIQI